MATADYAGTGELFSCTLISSMNASAIFADELRMSAATNGYLIAPFQNLWSLLMSDISVVRVFGSACRVLNQLREVFLLAKELKKPLVLRLALGNGLFLGEEVLQTSGGLLLVENVVDLLLAQAKGTQEVSIIYLVFINRYLPSKDEIQHFILIYIILATPCFIHIEIIFN